MPFPWLSGCLKCPSSSSPSCSAHARHKKTTQDFHDTPKWKRPRMRERLSEADLLMDATNGFTILADGARLRLFQRGVEVRGGNQQSVGRPKIHRRSQASFVRQPLNSQDGAGRAGSGRDYRRLGSLSRQPQVLGESQ